MNFILSFGTILVHCGFPEILLLDEINKDTIPLVSFFKKVQGKTTRETFQRYIGIYEPKRKYKGSSLKFCLKILRAIDFQILQLQRYRSGDDIVGNYRMSGEAHKEIKTLISSGNNQQVIDWLNTRYKPYAELNLSCGVYKILFKPTGHFYIGSTGKFSVREKQHFNDLRLGKHCNSELQNIWFAAHEKDFVFKIIERTTDYKYREKFWKKTADQNLLLNIYDNVNFKKIVSSTRINHKSIH